MERRIDKNDAHKLYAKIDLFNGQLSGERTMGPLEASSRNDKLDAEGSTSRWLPYASREGEGVQAA